MSSTNYTKKSSLHVSLVLVGSISFATCTEKGTRPTYKNLTDCISEWSIDDCDQIPSDSAHYSQGTYYGRYHSLNSSDSSNGYQPSKTTKATGFASISRGGFGHFSGFHSSGG